MLIRKSVLQMGHFPCSRFSTKSNTGNFYINKEYVMIFVDIYSNKRNFLHQAHKSNGFFNLVRNYENLFFL